ncbi:MAG: hypothetical protein FWE61_05675, partial [Micrococcales bacterium]|nr:hypothetical protein [Micrococcales bacterium]
TLTGRLHAESYGSDRFGWHHSICRLRPGELTRPEQDTTGNAWRWDSALLVTSGHQQVHGQRTP